MSSLIELVDAGLKRPKVANWANLRPERAKSRLERVDLISSLGRNRYPPVTD